jgi:hypothetical protein
LLPSNKNVLPTKREESTNASNHDDANIEMIEQMTSYSNQNKNFHIDTHNRIDQASVETLEKVQP